MKAQLEQAQDTIEKLREGNKEMKISIAGHMDICEYVLFKANIIVRKTLPLHRQVKNLYRKNRTLQAEIRALQEDNNMLNEELQATKSKVSRRNLNILVEAATSR